MKIGVDPLISICLCLSCIDMPPLHRLLDAFVLLEVSVIKGQNINIISVFTVWLSPSLLPVLAFPPPSFPLALLPKPARLLQLPHHPPP